MHYPQWIFTSGVFDRPFAFWTLEDKPNFMMVHSFYYQRDKELNAKFHNAYFLENTKRKILKRFTKLKKMNPRLPINTFGGTHQLTCPVAHHFKRFVDVFCMSVVNLSMRTICGHDLHSLTISLQTLFIRFATRLTMEDSTIDEETLQRKDKISKDHCGQYMQGLM